MWFSIVMLVYQRVIIFDTCIMRVTNWNTCQIYYICECSILIHCCSNYVHIVMCYFKDKLHVLQLWFIVFCCSVFAAFVFAQHMHHMRQSWYQIVYIVCIYIYTQLYIHKYKWYYIYFLHCMMPFIFMYLHTHTVYMLPFGSVAEKHPIVKPAGRSDRNWWLWL